LVTGHIDPIDSTSRSLRAPGRMFQNVPDHRLTRTPGASCHVTRAFDPRVRDTHGPGPGPGAVSAGLLLAAGLVGGELLVELGHLEQAPGPLEAHGGAGPDEGAGGEGGRAAGGGGDSGKDEARVEEQARDDRAAGRAAGG
jgi:hypothetical protein